MWSKQRIIRRPGQVATLCLVLGLSVSAPAVAQGSFDRNGSAAIPPQSNLESLRQWVEAEGFGLGFQWTMISAAAFTPAHSNFEYSFNFPEGLIQQQSASLSASFAAPLLLPNGAVIESVCLISEDTDSMGQNLGTLAVVEFDPDPSLAYSVDVATTVPLGFHGVCVNNQGIPYRSRADFDGDGTVGDIFYHLEMSFSTGNAVKQLVGMVILWRREMSPPPATPTFDDVPTNHPFYQQIEALAAAGISDGVCGDPNKFCPDGVLTRAQIAALLAEALGLHWPN